MTTRQQRRRALATQQPAAQPGMQTPAPLRTPPLGPPRPQIAKLLIIPFVAVMEMIWFRKRFTPPVIASMLVVAAGVAIV